MKHNYFRRHIDKPFNTNIS